MDAVEAYFGKVFAKRGVYLRKIAIFAKLTSIKFK